MKKYISLTLVFAMLFSITCSGFLSTFHAEEQIEKQIVILKLDDLQNNEMSVAGFEKVVQFLGDNDIKAGFGIISDVLASPASPDFISRIQAMANNPRVEIWNHGYSLSKAQKLNSSNADDYAEYSNQVLNSYLDTLKTTQNLVYDTLGVTMHSLGAPGNMTDAEFANAIKQFPEMKTIFFPSPASASSFKNMEIFYTYNWENPYRAANTRFDMESGTGNPSYDAFIANYNKGPDNSVMVLQGHPWGWDDNEFGQVQNIITFLKTKDVVFMTPFEYYMYKNPTASVQSTPSNPLTATSTPTPTLTPTPTPTPTPVVTPDPLPIVFDTFGTHNNGDTIGANAAADIGAWTNASSSTIGLDGANKVLVHTSASTEIYPNVSKWIDLIGRPTAITGKIKLPALVDTSKASRAYIQIKDRVANNTYWHLMMLNSKNNCKVYTGLNGATEIANNVFPLNTWLSFAIVIDPTVAAGANNVRLTLNGATISGQNTTWTYDYALPSAYLVSTVNLTFNSAVNGGNQIIWDDLKIFKSDHLEMSAATPTNASVTDAIKINLNHYVNTSTFTPSNVTVTKAGGGNLTVTGITADSANPDSFEIDCAEILDYETEYTVSLNSGVKDIFGFTCSNTAVFTTKADDGTNPDPIEGWPVLFEDDFQDENGIRPLTSNATDTGKDKWSTINHDANYDVVGIQEPGNTSNIAAKLYASTNTAVQYPQMRKCVDLSQGKTRIEFRVKTNPAYGILPGVTLRSQSGTQIPLITSTSDCKFRFGYGSGLVAFTNEWQTVRLEYTAATRMLDFYLTNATLDNSYYGPYEVPIPDGFSLADALVVFQATIPSGTALDNAYAYYDDVILSKQATAADPTVLMSPISILAGDPDVLPKEEFSTSPVITRSGSATAKFRINNNTGSEITPILVAAVYSGAENRLCSLKTANVPTIGISGVKDAEITFNIPDGITDGTVKFMLWDGFDTDEMRPYLAPLTKQVVTQRTLSLANVFQDGCVLQRDKPVRVFGEAPSGAEVTVSFGGSTAQTTAVEGRFLVEFSNTFSADSTPRMLTVSSGASTVTVSNVLVGDVLVGGGQSNMAMTFDSNLQKIPHPASVPENMRYFKLNSSAGVSDVGQRYIVANNNFRSKEKWQTITTSNVGGVSAVMYFAAKKMLEQNPSVPVGLVIDAWGGTLIQQWLSPDALFGGTDSAYTSWCTDYKNRTNLVDSIPYSPVSGLYHYQTATIMPYAAKAFVWYQGESNPQISLNYHIILKDMIEDYREKWKDENMPLFVIQLPGWHDSQWPSFRLKQAKVAAITDNAYVIVTNDTGDDRTLEQVVAAGYDSSQYSSVTVHPSDKQPIGDRLARSILANIDGQAIAFQGPTLSSVAGTGTTSVNLSFTGINDGLVSIASDGSLPGFETSTDGAAWTQAQAVISGSQVVLTSASTINYVRYGYATGVLRSLASTAENGETLFPAAPFRTDNNF